MDKVIVETDICPNCKNTKPTKYFFCFNCHELKKKQKGYKEYTFDSYKLDSKSELVICYFLRLNKVTFSYAHRFEINGKVYRPDFLLYDESNNFVIFEHFGLNDVDYVKSMNEKKEAYSKICSEHSNYYFIWTEEKDILDIRQSLGIKLNETPLKKIFWQ